MDIVLGQFTVQPIRKSPISHQILSSQPHTKSNQD